MLGRGDAGGAGCVGQKTGELPIFGEGAIAVEAEELIVLAEKHDHRQAMAAADPERLAQFFMRIAEEVANFDVRRDFDEALEDRALVNAFGAPRARQAGDFQVANETGK